MPGNKPAQVKMNTILPPSVINTYYKNPISVTEPIATIIQVLSLAEIAISKKDVVYWDVSENLNKHRETREFDLHVQKMLLFLEKIGGFQSSVVPCGGNGFFRTLLKNSETEECILIVHSWDPTAQYMKEYIQMNTNPQKPKFALIQYDLNKARTQIKNLRFVIPTKGGTLCESINLLPLVNEIKKTLPENIEGVSECIRFIKEEQQLIEESKILPIDI